jgi:hypothetical protein
VKIADVIPDRRNARKATKRSNEAVADSLKEFGAGRSILLDAQGHIIAGNTTVTCPRKTQPVKTGVLS